MSEDDENLHNEVLALIRDGRGDLDRRLAAMEALARSDVARRRLDLVEAMMDLARSTEDELFLVGVIGVAGLLPRDERGALLPVFVARAFDGAPRIVRAVSAFEREATRRTDVPA